MTVIKQVQKTISVSKDSCKIKYINLKPAERLRKLLA